MVAVVSTATVNNRNFRSGSDFFSERFSCSLATGDCSFSGGGVFVTIVRNESIDTRGRFSQCAEIVVVAVG